MISIIKDFWNTVLNRKSFLIPLSIISLMGYGFSLFNRTIGWDDLLRDHYFGSGNISLSGRWGMTVWIKILGYEDFDPFIDRFTALLLLVITSVLLVLLLFSIKKFKSIIPYSIAACAFVSYPLINEIWEYCGANFFLAGGLALSTLTIFILRNNQRNYKWVVLSGFLLLLPISSYEAAIFYYLCLICLVLFLDNFFNEKYTDFRCFIKEICYYSLPVVIAFILRIVVSFVIRMILGLTSVGGGATEINWLSETPLLAVMKIAGGNFIKYFLGAFVYFPITEFLIALSIFIVGIIVVSIKIKKGTVAIYGFLFIVSLFSQAIIQGNALPYRTAQTINLLIAIVAYMLAIKASQINKCFPRVLCYVFLFGLCWHQAGCLNRYLGLNNLRSENEEYIIRSIGEQIVRDYDKKPVIFISPYSSGEWIDSRVTVGYGSWNENIYNAIMNKIVPDSYKHYMSNRFVETNVNSATEEYSQIQAIFAYYGYDIDVVGPIEKPHTPEYLHKDTRLLKEAISIAKEKNMRPYEIYDNINYLIVNLSGKRSFLENE